MNIKLLYAVNILFFAININIITDVIYTLIKKGKTIAMNISKNMVNIINNSVAQNPLKYNLTNFNNKL